MCPECASNHRSLKDDTSSSRACWNCQVDFGKGKHRRWAWTIREFLCRPCFEPWLTGFLRVMPAHIKDLDIRCVDCGRRYATGWGFSFKDGLDKLLCTPCKIAFWQKKSVRNLNRHNGERKGTKEKTFYEHRCKVTRLESGPSLYKYFKAFHGKDWYRSTIEEEKWKEDILHPTPAFSALVEAGKIF
ncbi:hypothetical protein BJX63DRAFT_317225 [Aspergillus granulosus]|uniref:Uncharacterized protein n=1 Tax=Aspergillus granulosus TaxID=176169 RepID=A0ABR4H4Z1_9EURO